MFLTPDGEPFWGGTYFPPEPRHGMPGFADILKAVAELWREKPAVVTRNVTAIGDGLNRLAETAPAEPISPELVETIAEKLGRLHRPRAWRRRRRAEIPAAGEPRILVAGVRSAPAAPRCARRRSTTLDHICQGGIYDHLGGGFARYSTDERWLAPHFEKMLYDNAQLVELLTLVWQEERKPLYAARIAETIDWTLREMRLPEGVFASSLDADSEHEEGKFYVWTAAEIDAALGARAAAFRAVYDIEDGGNWEGKAIPNRLRDMALRLRAKTRRRSPTIARRCWRCARRACGRAATTRRSPIGTADDRRHRDGGAGLRARATGSRRRRRRSISSRRI